MIRRDPDGGKAPVGDAGRETMEWLVMSQGLAKDPAVLRGRDPGVRLAGMSWRIQVSPLCEEASTMNGFPPMLKICPAFGAVASEKGPGAV